MRVLDGHPRSTAYTLSGVASALVEVECLRTLDRLRLRHRLADSDVAARREAIFRLLEETEVVEAVAEEIVPIVR